MTRTNKNAPAEMPSNRPVRRYVFSVGSLLLCLFYDNGHLFFLFLFLLFRLRVDANNASKKTVDPR